ncbi:hypothetical protein ABEB36_011202 [Hypothenemus hampei]|uniref:PH domain-containing protein n=1 Tax=Hypothenemus hampei TaxID=57062 RepID=A0ABD1EEJ7_HYPHA
MFSCLWQLWEWIDPGKMDKFQQQKPYETPPQSSINQSTHPQYYQQIYNKTHAIQSSHQLNHAQRSSQHYPQYSSDQSIRTPQQETPKQPSNKPKTKENEKKQLRSPSARRPPNAPVSMQGWLHKQGSEGLMLWKKRWFVLSEYCLFYYKGLEEEKVLGSILLPSYKVSACGPDDKVNRKFAFKCEHVNMRTYILAADSQELMQQWIHVLSLACNLQNNLEPRKELRIPQTISDPESFKSNTSSAQSYLKNPIHNHTVSNTTDLSNSSLQELNQYNQPLYANAPPKPRRLVDGYCSPGPEILDRYPHYSKSPSYVKYLQEPMYLDNRIFVGAPNIDRRTPDTYGRNNTSKFRNISDYEDIYMEQNAYKRPLSPGALDNLKKVYPTVNVGYPIKSYGPPMEMLRPGFYPEQMRRPPIQTISRPHSADFLEYKSNKLDPVPSVIPVIQQPRPKSSLDINMYSKDAHSFPRPNNYFVDIQKDNDYFYSQERYAEKMRKSAQYLHKMPPAAVKYYQPASGYEYQSNFREELSNLQPVRSRSALSEGSLLCSQDIENDTLSRDYFPSQDVNLSTEQSVRVSADQFARSASARLSQNNPFEENVTRIEGERKREESMKRLLEWKQRMLQSPLNRKAQAQGYRGYPRKENAYAYAQKQKKVALPTRRSVHDLVQYNSYSSDDEENGNDPGNKHNTPPQAGRTQSDTIPDNQSLTHALFTSNALKPSAEPATPIITPTNQEGTLPELSQATPDLSLESFDDIKSNNVLVKTFLSEFQEKTVLEGNYMPMTPKKNILDLSEENHYVEMSRGVDSALMDPNDQQQYEMVCFSEGKIEPVYMEVPKKSQELPDILQSMKEKSDSSDADDEASKDLELSGQPKFSLSDTFRPASYYLGVSKTIAELQDSSDSELMSPPPIPANSPPLDDEDYLPKCPGSFEISGRSSEQFKRKENAEIRSSHLLDQDCSDTLSRMSSNSGSISSLNPKRPEDFSTPTDYGKIEDIQSVKKYFEGLKLSEDHLSEKDNVSEDGHAYENFLITKKIPQPSPLVGINKERLASPNDLAIGILNSNSAALVPYYYSDLPNLESSLTLNNQRENHGNKKDITHIINPLNEEKGVVLVEEARSASADFLNLNDKSDNIDKKNIYESDTLKRLDSNLDSRNVFLRRKADKFDQPEGENNGEKVRKSYSLEGLLEDVLNESHSVSKVEEGSFLWEEDSVWRQQLRSVSQRHTKSMDDLDAIDSEATPKKASRAITREVTYVNDMLFKYHETSTSKKTEIKKKGSFLIDRETLRQWDLMSSAPSADQLLKVVEMQSAQAHAIGNSGEGSTDDNGNFQETASGSISISAKDNLGRDTFPRAVTSKRSITPTMQSRSITNLDRSSYKNLTAYPGWHYCDQQDPNRALQNDIAPKGKLHVSAGELLGRTHEELVLLLIQLRRQQAQTFQAIESCYNEIDALQLHLRNLDQLKRLENLQKLERIKQNLLELEKQYEKRKPLVNLVDNMVKLGTLYRNPNERSEVANQIRERLEFNQYIQERRLMADEKRDWNRIEPSHMHLQEKVRQLYQLDSLIQEESRNLHNLQKGKEDIERALGGLRQKLLKGLNNPEEIEQARRQQYILENELSRVHLMLAQNSKKLEETVAGNARLEQELLVLKQKLQLARQQRMSPQFSNAGDSLPYLSGQALETDLERVQKKIGDLQKQREELSLQVRQLTDRSNIPNTYNHKNVSPLENQTINSTNKKKPTSSWRETDLDTMNSIDHGYDSYSSSSTTPLYINTDPKPSDFHCKAGSDSTSDDTTFSSNPMEKPEIKTVRIVKRESERRQRDREKTFNGKCEALLEEDDSSQGSSILFRPTSLNFKPKPPELSPVFKSEAARQIITEVSRKSPSAQGQRRAVPQERRRHHTAPHDNLVLLGSLDGRRARDDLDIERALRQRVDAPDLVRSTLSTKELKYNEETIDNILSTPNKIFIPERYIPEQMPQPTEEEQEKRKKKVESIKKMLSDTAIISTTATNDNKSLDKKLNAIGKCASASSILEEKKQREHLLQLNQILAKQVMEMSKVVAGKWK